MKIKNTELVWSTFRKTFLKELTHDVSLQLLLVINLLTIFFAVREGWGLETLIWVYWFQSIIIGFFNVIRIVRLENFSTDGLKINDQPILPTLGLKYIIAGLFLIPYAFFHFTYFTILLFGFSGIGKSTSIVEWNFVFLTSLVFFGNHLFSYMYNKERDTQKVNISTLMILPYVRILPMHITVFLAPIFAFFTPIPLLIFLLFKTGADMATHVLEHAFLRKKSEATHI
jgi:hypothetical protein